MGALTKEQLDRETAAWRADLAARGHDVDAPAKDQGDNITLKSVTVPTVHNAELIKALMAGIAPYIHALEQKADALTARVAELERSQKTYLGTWKADRQYSAMSEVTFEGARWFCCKATGSRPGTTADWVMQEKSHSTLSPRTESVPAHHRNGSTLAAARPRT